MILNHSFLLRGELPKFWKRGPWSEFYNQFSRGDSLKQKDGRMDIFQMLTATLTVLLFPRHFPVTEKTNVLVRSKYTLLSTSQHEKCT